LILTSLRDSGRQIWCVMAFNLNDDQRRQVLRFVDDHSTYSGAAVDLDKTDVPQWIAGVDVGRALLEMESEGLCETEEPAWVALTDAGIRWLDRGQTGNDANVLGTADPYGLGGA
jgi:hypothetical protein